MEGRGERGGKNEEGALFVTSDINLLELHPFTTNPPSPTPTPSPHPPSFSGIIGLVDPEIDSSIDWSKIHSIGFREVVR